MSGKVEPLANNNGAAAPNWAYVPTTNTNVGPSRRTSGALRKRAARSSNVIGGIQDGGFGGGGSVLGSSRGELTTRQSAAILRRLNDLERDNHQDVNIPIVTTRGKDIVAKSSRSKTTSNVRRILLSQKTFRNYLDDEEAAIALQQQQQQSDQQLGPSRVSSQPSARAAADSDVHFPPASNPSTVNSASQELPITPQDSDPLLRSYIPALPSERVMKLLLAEPPLSYNAARATLPPAVMKRPPARQFCDICGYWGRVKCVKCGARICGLDCSGIHGETRCERFYA